MNAAIRHRPDGILLDLNMPVMNGWETARRLRDHAETRQTPIAAFTVDAAEAKGIERLRTHGFDAYLSKIDSFPKLVGEIGAMLRDCRFSRA